jgi:hypothetical protein
LHNAIDQILVVLLKASIAANVDSRLQDNVNRAIEGAPRLFVFALIEVPFSGLHPLVRAVDDPLNLLASLLNFRWNLGTRRGRCATALGKAWCESNGTEATDQEALGEHSHFSLHH